MQTQMKVITAQAFAEALAGTWMAPVKRAKRRKSRETLPADVTAWAEQHTVSRIGEISWGAFKTP